MIITFYHTNKQNDVTVEVILMNINCVLNVIALNLESVMSKTIGRPKLDPSMKKRTIQVCLTPAALEKLTVLAGQQTVGKYSSALLEKTILKMKVTGV
jgi:hypothetical protein